MVEQGAGFLESADALDRKALRTLVAPICERQERRFQDAAYANSDRLRADS